VVSECIYFFTGVTVVFSGLCELRIIWFNLRAKVVESEVIEPIGKEERGARTIGSVHAESLHIEASSSRSSNHTEAAGSHNGASESAESDTNRIGVVEAEPVSISVDEYGDDFEDNDYDDESDFEDESTQPEFGSWMVREVEFYSDEECERSILRMQ
jgi:hypothetical protein